MIIECLGVPLFIEFRFVKFESPAGLVLGDNEFSRDLLIMSSILFCIVSDLIFLLLVIYLNGKKYC